MIIAGLMSGSSLDGLDVAICDISEENDRLKWEMLTHITIPFTANLTDRFNQIADLTAKELIKLDHEFAAFCARSVTDFAANQNLDIDYIASHGHTIYHEPQDGYTLQIGNGGVIAALSRIPTICDFRVNDIALGGQGAPIVPIVEKYLFPGIKFFLNLGGIANISIHSDAIIAYDVCPCNQILNQLSQQKGKPYDEGGAMAAQGVVHTELLDSLNSISYFQAQAPKSLDNSWVRNEFYSFFEKSNLAPADGLATMTTFIAQQVAAAVRSYEEESVVSTLSELMITGGGAYNSYLLNCIVNELPENIKIKKSSSALIEAKEAILMALMGYLRVKEKPNTLTTVTGASGQTCGGAIYIPYTN